MIYLPVPPIGLKALRSLVRKAAEEMKEAVKNARESKVTFPFDAPAK